MCGECESQPTHNLTEILMRHINNSKLANLGNGKTVSFFEQDWQVQQP